MTSQCVLSVKKLQTYYRTRLKENIHAVDNVSLELVEGRVLGVSGESGCGKSTLALSLMGFYFPPLNFKAGSIEIKGVDIMSLPYEKLRSDYLGKEIAYIPQAAMNALNPTRKIIHFIEDIIKEHNPKMTKQEIDQFATERFERLNLPKRVLQSFPCELSGGMKQRAVIAISTILDPTILIADEPTSALDVTSQKAVIKLIKKLMDEGFVKSMIFITHELPLLAHVADDIIVMYAGEIIEKGETKDVIFNSIHPYARALMNSIIVPEKGMKGHKLAAIPGTPPNLKNVQVGCRFAARCQYVTEDCKKNKPIEYKQSGTMTYQCIFDENALKELYNHE